MIENIRSLNLIKAFSLFLLTGLHLGLFLNLSYQLKLAAFLDAKMTFGIILLVLSLLPVLISKIVYKSFRSQLEFALICYVTTAAVTIAFLQINNRADITTVIPLIDRLGLSFTWGSNLGLIMLTIVAGGIFYDLLFGHYLESFRLSFTSAFALQLILSLGFFSYIHLISIGDFSQRYYKVAWLDLLLGLPIWFLTTVFASVSALISIFYFGRGNTLLQVRPNWSKIAWRLLIFLFHFELVAMIIILPQNYWWKVLFYILIWDFMVIPLARVYKQSTELFWDRLKVSLIYHLVLFTIVFWISNR